MINGSKAHSSDQEVEDHQSKKVILGGIVKSSGIEKAFLFKIKAEDQDEVNHLKKLFTLFLLGLNYKIELQEAYYDDKLNYEQEDLVINNERM